MSFLWDAAFIQVLDRTGPLMLDRSGTPYVSAGVEEVHSTAVGRLPSPGP
jgi:hypothetical protein